MGVAPEPGCVTVNESDHLVRLAGATIWANVLPLLFMSMLLSIATVPALYLATAMGWLVAWPVLATGVAPVWAGVMAASARLLEGDAVTNRQTLALVRRHGRAGLRIGLVPAIVGTLLLGCLAILDRQPQAGWVAVPLLLGLGIAIVVALALVPIFTVAAEAGLTGVPLWLTSAGIAFANPFSTIGTALLLGMVVWGAAGIGPAALLGLAPLAVLGAAVSRHALDDTRGSGGGQSTIIPYGERPDRGAERGIRISQPDTDRTGEASVE